jgi:hypothetical protein
MYQIIKIMSAPFVVGDVVAVRHSTNKQYGKGIVTDVATDANGYVITVVDFEFPFRSAPTRFRSNVLTK